MKQTKRELLSPAGSPESLIAAVNAGADAVYLGGPKFGARAYAKNFTEEEVLSGISYAHLHGAKVYMTVNTCLKNLELKELSSLAPFYEAGLDAVLVQDFGVLMTLRELFPGLPLHASTQMSIAGASGAAFLKALGVSRIVTARELSLSEIRSIHEKVDVEIESFVHGALCYSYSGLCLMSSLLGGRSGNRGRCAGTCRLPFQVGGEERPRYPLSMKDLCALDLLPEMVRSGVVSFKIEGRMKSPEYTAGVTSIYRKYLDLVDDPDYTVEMKDREALLSLGNRSGFTTGYLKAKNGPELITGETSAFQGAEKEELQKKYGAFLPESPIRIRGTVSIKKGEAASLILEGGGQCARGTGPRPEPSTGRPLTEETVREKLIMTGGTGFVFEDLTVELEEGLFLPLRELKELRRSGLSALSEKLLPRRNPSPEPEVPGKILSPGAGEQPSAERRPSPEGKPYRAALILRRTLLSPLLEEKTLDLIYLDSAIYPREGFLSLLKEDLEACEEAGKQAALALPFVFRRENELFFREIFRDLRDLPLAVVLARTYDELGFLSEMGWPGERVRLDHTLYTWSNRAEEAFRSLGFSRQTLPLELSEKELSHRRAESSELLIYGRIPLMITAGCVHKNFRGCDRKMTVETLKDRYEKTFPVLNLCGECTNLILNADILDLREDGRRGFDPEGLRYQFTLETPEEVKEILAGNKIPGSYTRGHYRRGVE